MSELSQILEQYGEDDYKVLAKAAVCNEAVVIINEKAYTQKELEDPETLKKLISRAKTEQDCKQILDLLISLMNIVGDRFLIHKADNFLYDKMGFKLNFISNMLVGITLSSIHRKEKEIGTDILSRVQRNKVIELKQKTIELRDKAMNDNSPEGKRIVKNCTEAINNIDKYLNELDTKKSNNDDGKIIIRRKKK